MKPNFEEAKLQNKADFLRDTGLSLDKFIIVINLVTEHIKRVQKQNPNKAKGIKLGC